MSLPNNVIATEENYKKIIIEPFIKYFDSNISQKYYLDTPIESIFDSIPSKITTDVWNKAKEPIIKIIYNDKFSKITVNNQNRKSILPKLKNIKNFLIPESNPKPKPESEPESKPESEPESKPEYKPKPESKPEYKPKQEEQVVKKDLDNAYSDAIVMINKSKNNIEDFEKKVQQLRVSNDVNDLTSLDTVFKRAIDDVIKVMIHNEPNLDNNLVSNILLRRDILKKIVYLLLSEEEKKEEDEKAKEMERIQKEKQDDIINSMSTKKKELITKINDKILDNKNELNKIPTTIDNHKNTIKEYKEDLLLNKEKLLEKYDNDFIEFIPGYIEDLNGLILELENKKPQLEIEQKNLQKLLETLEIYEDNADFSLEMEKDMNSNVYFLFDKNKPPISVDNRDVDNLDESDDSIQYNGFTVLGLDNNRYTIDEITYSQNDYPNNLDKFKSIIREIERIIKHTEMKKDGGRKLSRRNTKKKTRISHRRRNLKKKTRRHRRKSVRRNRNRCR